MQGNNMHVRDEIHPYKKKNHVLLKESPCTSGIKLLTMYINKTRTSKKIYSTPMSKFLEKARATLKKKCAFSFKRKSTYVKLKVRYMKKLKNIHAPN